MGATENDASYSAIRHTILDELRRVVHLQDDQNRNEEFYGLDIVRGIDTKYAGYPKSEVWRALQELFYEGVLIPVPKRALRDPHTVSTANFPQTCFTVSDFGKRFLESTKYQPDPYDATTILNPLRARNIANDTVEAYVPEAVKALQARAYRGTVMLVGVASESVTEDLYATLLTHLSPAKATKFQTDLSKKYTSAEGRWNAFRARFPGEHAECIGDELTRRFENVLEPQLKLFKQNRDDAAHRRATLIGPETAMAAITSFIPFGLTAADVVEALKSPCKHP